MAKTQIIIFLILILYSFEQSDDGAYTKICSQPIAGSDKYQCLDRENDEFDELGMHCCHRTNKLLSGQTTYECELMTERVNYDDIDGFIAREKEANPNYYEDITIDCFQKYISYNLVLLIAFLFVIN